MKAIILAAGKGSRLGSITENFPKPMICYKGKPILEHNIELCKNFGIKDIYINLYHHPEHIISYFGNGEKWGVNINYIYEEILLGTAGAVKNIFKKFNFLSNSQVNNEFFFVIYGDNFSNCDLTALNDLTTKQNCIASIAFHYRKDVSTSGVAEFNNSNQIIKFIEKPKAGTTKSKWVNAGIYNLNTKILEYIPDGISDFSYDIFPKLLNLNIPIYGLLENTEVLAFDTLELLEKNSK